MRPPWIIWAAALAFLPRMAAAAPPVTSYSAMTAELRQDAQRSPWIRLAAIGKSHDGRMLWMARVLDPRRSPSKALRVLILCRQHGDEPASTEANLALLRQAAAGRYHPPCSVCLYIVPMVNPDGAEAGTRVNGVGADLNRDWGTFSQPETRAVAHAAALIQPEIVADEHNWDATDTYNANCLEVTRGGQSPWQYAERELQAQTVAGLGSLGFSVAPTSYGSNADPRLAHRYFSRIGIVSFLVETHSGSPNDTADYMRRQALYAALARLLARRYASAKGALDAAEPRTTSLREAALFPLSVAAAAVAPQGTPPRRSRLPLWLWPLLAYGLMWLVRAITCGSGSATARTPVFAPASARRPAGRRDTRRRREHFSHEMR